MRFVLILTMTLPAFAGDMENFADNSLNYTQRNEACIALRGAKTPEAVAAMSNALGNAHLQACAARNLRIAGAIDALKMALGDKDPSVRAVAAREIGSMQNAGLRGVLRKTADDLDLLVASNAVEGLVRYEDHSSLPELREIAGSGGLAGSLALEALIDWRDPQALLIGRKLLTSGEPGEKLAGIRAIGAMGNASDLPKLRELMRDDVAIGAGQRGFGLMPAISIGCAAQTAIQTIETRASK